VGQSKVEKEEKAGRPCSNSERTQEKRATLVDTGHRSRPDLSQHLPAPAFSPFDACLLPPPLFSTLSFASSPSQWCGALPPSRLQSPLTTVVSQTQSRGEGERKRYQPATANACKEGNNVYGPASFLNKRTWLPQEFIHPNSPAARDVSSASVKARC
jgi:hypothetical protein